MDQDSILYILPRYHTNQHPIVEALVERGHDVSLLAFRESKTGESETAEHLVPETVRFSFLWTLIWQLVRNRLMDRHRYLYGLPSLSWYYRYLKEKDPDVIVVREYSTTGILTIVFGRILGSHVVFYDQAPVDDPEWGKRRTAVALIYLVLFGHQPTRYSPVEGQSTNKTPLYRSYYIPFAMEPAPSRKKNSNDIVRILTIGKLHQPRKNHIEFLRCIEKIARVHNIRATIIGSLESEDDAHYQRILEFVETNELGDIVDVKANLSYESVQSEYADHDLFVLPSENEPAAVSHLEAMSHGLAVICSDTNGTSSYVASGENGYIFESGNGPDLCSRIEDLVSDRERLEEFGQRSLERTQEEYSQERFYERFSGMIDEIPERG